MTGRQSMWVWGFIVVTLAALGIGLGRGTAADIKTVRPEQLLPANSLLYLSGIDSAEYKSAYEKTAAYDAFQKSGLVPALTKLINGLVKQVPVEQVAEIHRGLALLVDKGMSVSLSAPSDSPMPIPALTIVFHEGSSFDASITRAVTAATGNSEAKVSESRHGSRTIHSVLIPDTPGLEVSWWSEGNHLVVLAGIKALEGALEVADGKQPNITKNPLWKKYRETPADPEQVLAAVAWLDVPSLVKAYSQIPIPKNNNEKPVTVGDILEVIGLTEVGTLAIQSGYKGKASWSVVTAESHSHGEAADSVRTLTLEDLPPIPVNAQMFLAGTCDLSKFYDSIVARIRQGANRFGTPKDVKEFDDHLKQIGDILGFDPKADLLDCLGNTYCIYQGSSVLQGSAGFVFEVRDAERLKKTIDSLLQRIPKNAKASVERTPKLGREIVSVGSAEVPIGISYAIDKKWLIIGGDAQVVHAALLRLDGKLDRWKPTAEHHEALAALPQKFTSIAVSDPRGGVGLLTSLAPVVVGVAETALNYAGDRIPIRMPISQIDLPPAELVVQPMFPNVTVSVSEANRWRSISRESVSVNANGTMVAVGASAIGVALLLPAVQQARTAARRTESRNNLKQLALAAHNFENTYRNFPPNTDDPKRAKVKPQERIGWLADVLPFIEQANVYQGLDSSKPWSDDANKQSAQTVIPGLLNPELNGKSNRDKDGHGVTHYVGNGGLGVDGPNLPVNNPKAGAFGFNRKTRINDFRDGTSNTIMAGETYKDYGPWVANTTATIRPLTKKPYINGPDGFGSPNQRANGGMFMFCDGSVRFISKNIDPEVFEATMTLNGGEARTAD